MIPIAHIKRIAIRAIGISIILFLSYSSDAQMRQVYIDPSSEFNEIRKLNFFSPSTGFVAFNNFIGYTTDSGRTFIQRPITNGNVDYNFYPVNLTFGFHINGVKAFNQNNIIAYGDYGAVPAILVSNNGGNSYIVIYHTQLNLSYFDAIEDMVFPENNSIGYAIEANRIIKSFNSGQSWSPAMAGTDIFFTDIEAVDNNHVFAISTGSNRVFRTSNGTNWSEMSIPAGDLRYLYFLTANTGWVNVNSGIYKTVNGGATWTLQNDPTATPYGWNKIRFVDDNTGYAIGDRYNVWKTLNSGSNWEPLPRDNNYTYFGYGYHDLQCISSSQLWAGGDHHLLELSTNGGGTPLPKAHFKIDTTGVLATRNVSLINYSRTGYTYQWQVNGINVSSSYNATYVHNIFSEADTIKLIVSDGVHADTALRVQFFHPPVIVSSFSPATAATGNTVTITGLSFYDIVSVTFGGVEASSFTVPSQTTISAIVGNGQSGQVKVVTLTGRDSLPGFIYIPPPVITSFSPVSSVAGTTVTITGDHFENTSFVSFGGVPAVSFIVLSPTTITAVTPSGGSGSVSVTCPGGTTALGGYIALPTMTSFTPASGTQETRLQITGTSLTGISGITVGGVNVLSFTINSSTSITAIVGSGATGSVIVSKPGGSSALPGFTWFPPPVITSFSPTNGPVNTVVTITGTGFNPSPNANTVYFGAVKAAISAASSTSLTVTVPIGATFSEINVTSNNLIGYSAFPFLVTFPNGGSITGNSFGARTTISTTPGIFPQRVFLHDLDGDGKPDLIASKSTSLVSGTGILLYRNTSTNSVVSFANPIDIGNLGYEDLSIADLDGDSKPELAVIWDNKIVILKNISTSGTIAFSAGTTIISGNFSSVRLAEADGDGKTDVIGTANGVGTLIYRNISEPGELTFLPAVELWPFGSDLQVTDLDGDKKPDIILSGESVLKNNSTIGNIIFTSPISIPNSVHSSCRIADIDGDGKTDIITSDNNTSVLSVTRNISTPGNIQFEQAIEYGATISPAELAISDLDGDGKPDVAGTYINNSFGIFKNVSTPGNISLGAKVDYVPGNFTNGHSLALGDINGDGKNDVVVTSGSEESVFIYLNNVKPEPFIRSFTPTIGVTGTTVTITGVNFIGTTSVTFGGTPTTSFTVNSPTSITAIVGTGSAGIVSVTNGFGTGSLGSFAFGIPPSITSFFPATAAVGATLIISGNNFSTNPAGNNVYVGGTRAAVTSASATSISVIVPFGSEYKPVSVTCNNLTGYSSQNFTTVFPTAPAFSMESFAVRYDRYNSASTGLVNDIDGDNKLDLVYKYAPDKFGVTLNTSSSGNLDFAPGLLFNAASGVNIGTMADFDGDGKEDVAWACADSISLSRNTSSPGMISFDGPRNFQESITPYFRSGFTSGDMDVDGKPDLVSADGKIISIIRNSSTPGNINFDPRVIIPSGPNTSQVFLEDIDGDHKSDMISSSTFDESFVVFRNTSVPGNLSFAQKVSFGQTPAVLYTGDIDNDGKKDVFTMIADTVYIYRNSSNIGTVSFALPVPIFAGYSSVDSRLSTNDLDGDGKVEIIVGNFDLSSFSILKNSSTPGNISFLPNVDLEGPESPYIITSGDMDMDGKQDIVVFNSDYGASIFRNIIGTAGPSILSFTPVSCSTGDTIHITGERLNNATAITLGGTPASAFTILSPNDAIVEVGPGSSGNVGITTPAGISALHGFVFGEAPVISGVSPMTATPGKLISINGANFTGITSVKFGGFEASSFTINSSTSITAIVNTGGGSGDIKISNTTDTAIYPGFSFILPPVISSFTHQGAHGAEIYITGMNFSGATLVTFGGIPVNYVIESNTTIKANMGEFGASGIVSVTTPAGVASMDGFHFQGRAKVESFYPVTGTTGASIFITGLNVAHVIGVRFGNTPASSYTVTSPTTITAVVGNGGGSGAVTLITDNGEAGLDGFTYVSASIPVINSFAPATGGAGSNITITGINLSGATAVTIGGVAVTSFTVNSATSITVVLGNGLSGNVVVTTPVGIAMLEGFIYSAAPVIHSFSPQSASPGSTLIINGNNFNPVPGSNLVYFGTVKASVLSATSSNLIVKVPIYANLSPISVTVAGLTGMSNNSFIPSFAGTNGVDAKTFALRFDSGRMTNPHSITIADIDGDGKTDLNIGNRGNPYNSNLTFMLNTSAPGSLSLGSRNSLFNYPPYKIYHADFDGDGIQDVATENNQSANGIEVFRNTSTTGNVSLEPGLLLPVFVDLNRMTIGDFDGDGKADIVVMDLFGNIRIFKNTSTGTVISFAPSQFLATYGMAHHCITEDIDSDGKPDIVLAGTGMGIMRNISTPGNFLFEPMISKQIMGASTAVFCGGDLNGDSKTDLVLVVTNPYFVSVYKNKSTPGFISFDQPIQYNTGLTPYAIALGDVDGNDKVDIVIANTDENSISVLTNKSSGGNIDFNEQIKYPTNSPPSAIAVGDIDGDTRNDIVVTNPVTNSISILRNQYAVPIGVTGLTMCANGNASIQSNITGTNYQWQQLNGTGFTNLSGNANFIGTNTSQLQLVNIPSSWYGYKFRCLVDGNSTNVSSIIIANTWIGAVNNNWENPQNWSCAIVPDNYTDVTINTGTVVINSNVIIRSLRLNPGVQLTVTAGNTLTILH